MGISTRVDLNHDRIVRSHDLDEIARLLFPGSPEQQRIFVAIFVELKWAEDQFLPKLEPIADRYGLSRRVLETVRAKMRRLGSSTTSPASTNTGATGRAGSFRGEWRAGCTP